MRWTWLPSLLLFLTGCETASSVTPADAQAAVGSGFCLAVSDSDSASTLIMRHGGDVGPVRILDGPSLRLQRVRAAQVVVAGIWTVAFDIPGDEMSRIDALVDQFGEVHLVWQDVLVRTWNSGSIEPHAKRYGQECYIPGAGLRDVESANAAAQAISLLHAGDGAGQPK